MYLRSRSLTALLSIATVLLGGCLDRPLRPLNPCTVSGVVNEVAVTQINEIDLLFLVDNSASMRQELDRSLAAAASTAPSAGTRTVMPRTWPCSGS